MPPFGHGLIFVVSLVVFVIWLFCVVIAVRAKKGSYAQHTALISLWFCIAAMLYCAYQLGIAAGVIR